MNNLSKSNPCMDCTDRHPACHGHCEKYITWRCERDELKESILKQKTAENTLRDVAVEGALKGKKRKRAMR